MSQANTNTHTHTPNSWTNLSTVPESPRYGGALPGVSPAAATPHSCPYACSVSGRTTTYFCRWAISLSTSCLPYRSCAQSPQPGRSQGGRCRPGCSRRQVGPWPARPHVPASLAACRCELEGEAIIRVHPCSGTVAAARGDPWVWDQGQKFR